MLSVRFDYGSTYWFFALVEVCERPRDRGSALGDHGDELPAFPCFPAAEVAAIYRGDLAFEFLRVLLSRRWRGVVGFVGAAVHREDPRFLIKIR